MNWKHWFLQLAIAFDQFLNVLLTPGTATAWADETFSSRVYRMQQSGSKIGNALVTVIDFMFKWAGPEHCKRSFEEERGQRQSPPETRQGYKPIDYVEMP